MDGPHSDSKQTATIHLANADLSYDGAAVGTNADASNPIWNFGTSSTPADATFYYNGPVD
jgi:hypothetical protein